MHVHDIYKQYALPLKLVVWVIIFKSPSDSFKQLFNYLWQVWLAKLFQIKLTSKLLTSPNTVLASNSKDWSTWSIV